MGAGREPFRRDLDAAALPEEGLPVDREAPDLHAVEADDRLEIAGELSRPSEVLREGEGDRRGGAGRVVGAGQACPYGFDRRALGA